MPIPAENGSAATAGPADSEALYRTLFEVSPDAIVTFCDGRYVDCNQATIDLFGLSGRDELRNSPVGDFSPPTQPDGRPSGPTARDHFTRALEQGRFWFDWTYRSRSGREFPARVFLQRVDVADSTLVQAVIRDVSEQKEAESRLEQQRKYLEAVLQGSPMAIMVTGMDTGRIRFANDAARRMLALDEGDQPAVDTLWAYPQERERFLEELRNNGLASGEATLRRPDGRTFLARIDWQYNPGNENEVLCWSIDISGHREMLQRLHQHERMLQRIFEHLPVALYVKDVHDEFRYTLCNRKIEELFGVPVDEVIGATDFDILPADMAARHREEDLAIARTAQPQEIPDEPIETADGETVYVRRIKFAVPDAQGKPSRVVGICEDVTERREAEKALHASERRFRELAEHAPVGIYLTDARGACVFVNEQWQRTSGMDQREAAGTGWTSVVHPDDRARVVQAWHEFVHGGESYALEHRMKPVDGEEVWVSTEAVPFRDAAGSIIGFLGTTTDITERKRFERRLKASRDEAQRANQAKSEFLSRMSHELRTPLNAVLGFGQLLQMGSEGLSDTQKEGVDQILAGGEHLLQLIDDVLDYSRIDTGHLSLGIQHIDIAGPLDRAVSLVQAMAQRYDVRIELPDAPAPRIVADPRRLQQLLVNLLSNAIKYNRPGGDVRVRIARLGDGMVRIAIEDTGVGIREQDQERLFEPFERIFDPNRMVEGTGIGLSICKRLVELMGGRIGFESELGVGSTFWIDVPAAEVGDDEEDWLFGTLDTLVDPEALAGLRLLYVEDHLASIRFMSQIIRRLEGCELLTATNGTDGVALAKSAAPDLILMDLNLPGLSGYESLALLRNDERTAGIPVIALSATASADTRQSAQAAGFHQFLSKPLQLGELFEAVVQVCQRPDGGAQS